MDNTPKYIFVKVKANSKENKIEFDTKNNSYFVQIKKLPIEGKANKELIKLFKKELNLKVEIISGHNSKIKKLKILN